MWAGRYVPPIATRWGSSQVLASLMIGREFVTIVSDERTCSLSDAAVFATVDPGDHAIGFQRHQVAAD
jgi:hypothetical protein